MAPSLSVTRGAPVSTTVYSSNSGVWPGSTQPAGLRMRAMLTSAVCEFTLPKNSSIVFGLLPTALINVGFAMSLAKLLYLRMGQGCFTEGNKGNEVRQNRSEDPIGSNS